MTPEQLLLVLASFAFGAMLAFFLMCAIIYALWGFAVSASVAIGKYNKER